MTVCQCCGQPAPAGQPTTPVNPEAALTAACDVLVMRALELLGKRIVRSERSRFRRMGDRPFHEAHVLWQPDPSMVDKALADAWTTVEQVLTDHGCCGVTVDQLTLVLDRYVRDMVVTMRGHSLQELRYRLGVYVGASA